MNYRTYLERGWSVIPVGLNKVPLIKWDEYQTRLPNEDEVKTWESKFPNANVGIVTGKVSGLAVIDLDGPTGLDSGSSLKLSSNLEVVTGRGKHLYYQMPNILQNKVRLFPGLDIRGEGGYVLAPPSKHESGVVYAWNGDWTASLLEFPQSILSSEPPRPSLGVRPTNVVPSDVWVRNTLDNLTDGTRHQSFLRVAGYLHAKKLSDDRIFDFLKPYAEKSGFDLDALKALILKYSTPPEPVSETAGTISSFLQTMEEVEWIVPGLIARRSLGFVAGLPETNKTWLMIDLAVECAGRNGKWIGKFPCKPSRVLYIDQERFKGETQRRFKAVIKAKGIQPSELDLFIRCGTTTRIDLQPSFEAFRRELAEIKPDLIIVDSFATFKVADENDRSTMQVVLESIKKLRNEFGCTFLFIDHETKSVFQDTQEKEPPNMLRMVGSIGKAAAAELVLTVRKNNPGSSFVYVTKSTLASTPDPFMVRVVDMDEVKSRIMVTGAGN